MDYFFELGRSDPPRLFRIVFGAAAVDGSDVGKVLVLGESQPHLQQEAVDLGVEFYPEECHKLVILKQISQGRV